MTLSIQAVYISSDSHKVLVTNLDGGCRAYVPAAVNKAARNTTASLNSICEDYTFRNEVML